MGFSSQAGRLVVRTQGIDKGPVTITAATSTVVTGSPHGLVVNDAVTFGNIVGTTGILAGVTYYVKTVPIPTSVTISSTIGGVITPMATDGSAASFGPVTPGVYAADTGTAGVVAMITAGVMEPKRELLITDPEIGGGRDVVDALLGTVSYSASYEGYARPDSLLTFLNACLGTTSKTSNSPVAGVNEFMVEPVDSASLPFLSIEEKIADGFDVFHYRDAVVNTLKLEADANGYLKFSAGLISKFGIGGQSAAPSPLPDISPLIVGTNILVSYNGVNLPGKSFSLEINNNFADDDFRLGSLFLNDLTAKRREVNATFGIRETSSALWRQAVHGVSSSPSVTSGLTTKQPLVITASAYDVIGVTAQVYKITITIPNFTLKPYSQKVSGDDILDSDIEGSAVRPSQGAKLLDVKVLSSLAAIA